MLKTAIANTSGFPAALNTAHGEDAGLVVATRPHKIYESRTMFFSDEFGDIDMAHAALYGDTPEMVHDGTDNVYWTGSINKGTWVLDDTGTITDHTPDDAGDHCIDGTNTGKDGEIDLTHPTSIDLSSYAAITGWIYVTGWLAGKNMELRCMLLGGTIGNQVNVNNYISVGVQGVWQQFQIPLADLGLVTATIDVIRIKNRDAANQFYLDDIQIEQIDTVFKAYILKPDTGTTLHVTKILTTYVAAYNMDHADATVAFLSYDKTLGVTLTNGWLFQRIQNGEVMDSQVVQSLHEMAFTGARLGDVICDGVNTMLTVEYNYPVPEILKSENLDCLKVQMQDGNMDDFISMRMAVHGYQENN